MAKTIVGVDIGSSFVRAVEMKRDRRGRLSVARAKQLRVPEGAVRAGEVVEINTVADVLKQLWSAGGFTSKDVVLGVGNPKVLVRNLTVPKLSRKDIRRALPFQVQDMLPVPVADALLDFYPSTESVTEQGPVVSGLLVAAVKESVMANVAAVQRAGLNPVEVDLIPFALNRVHVRGPEAMGTSALIDIGCMTTNVMVARDGVPQFVRIISAGGADVTKALASRLGVSAEDAEAGKREFGLTRIGLPPEQFETAAIVREVTHELLNSLRNTLSFYINSHHGERVDRVILSGGGASLPRFGEALFELSRIPVILSEPLGRFPLAKTMAVSDDAAQVADMTVALGLALRGAA